MIWSQPKTARTKIETIFHTNLRDTKCYLHLHVWETSDSSGNGNWSKLYIGIKSTQISRKPNFVSMQIHSHGQKLITIAIETIDDIN